MDASLKTLENFQPPEKNSKLPTDFWFPKNSSFPKKHAAKVYSCQRNEFNFETERRLFHEKSSCHKVRTREDYSQRNYSQTPWDTNNAQILPYSEVLLTISINHIQ